jgi:methylated-DNA-[protein]-cysteine S-methyltransferase
MKVPPGVTLSHVPIASSSSSFCWRQDSRLTLFQTKVYDALCQVPRGQVVTYQSLANAIGCRSCQAVGQALRRNPYAPIIPCHRVIKSDLTLGGFFGHMSGPKMDEKVALLQSEGVRIEVATGKIDRQYVYHFHDTNKE